MKKWKKIFSLVVITAGFLVLAPNYANANSCGFCGPFGWDAYSFTGFDVGVDFLWWKPCVDDLNYGGELKSDKFEHHGISPDWEPGVRVTLTIPSIYYDYGFNGSWTFIESNDSSSFSNSNDVLGTLLHGRVVDDLDSKGIDAFDKAKGSWEACYHEWDLLFYYNITCNSGNHLMPFFGVAGISIYQELKADYLISGDTFAKAELESDYWGAGLRIGAFYNYRFSDRISFFVKSSGTILAGVADSKHFSEGKQNSNDPFEFKKISKDDNSYQIVPGYYIGAGLTYDTNIYDFDFSFKLGYEFVNWYNLPNQRNFSDDTSSNISHASSSPSTRTFGFQGLTAGLVFSF